MHNRVAISLAAEGIQFLDCCQMIHQLSTNMAMVSDSLEELVYLTAFWAQVCQGIERLSYFHVGIQDLVSWFSLSWYPKFTVVKISDRFSALVKVLNKSAIVMGNVAMNFLQSTSERSMRPDLNLMPDWNGKHVRLEPSSEEKVCLENNLENCLEIPHSSL